jgi:hypothetical protein
VHQSFLKNVTKLRKGQMKKVWLIRMMQTNKKLQQVCRIQFNSFLKMKQPCLAKFTITDVSCLRTTSIIYPEVKEDNKQGLST